MAHGLSKSRLQAFRQCPKRLWLAVHRPDLREVCACKSAFKWGTSPRFCTRTASPSTPRTRARRWR